MAVKKIGARLSANDFDDELHSFGINPADRDFFIATPVFDGARDQDIKTRLNVCVQNYLPVGFFGLYVTKRRDCADFTPSAFANPQPDVATVLNFKKNGFHALKTLTQAEKFPKMSSVTYNDRTSKTNSAIFRPN